MGFWFGKFSNVLPWRKTPTKIGESWYTPTGSKVNSPPKYFAKIDENGKLWKGNTGWKKK